MERAGKPHRKSVTRMTEEVTGEAQRKKKEVPNTDASHKEVDEVLAEIDEALAEEEADRKAAERQAFKEKLRSINFIGRRAVDPCASTVRVPDAAVEDLLRSGLFTESDCIDC